MMTWWCWREWSIYSYSLFQFCGQCIRCEYRIILSIICFSLFCLTVWTKGCHGISEEYCTWCANFNDIMCKLFLTVALCLCKDHNIFLQTTEHIKYGSKFSGETNILFSCDLFSLITDRVNFSLHLLNIEKSGVISTCYFVAVILCKFTCWIWLHCVSISQKCIILNYRYRTEEFSPDLVLL
jgi:hypothetical protein